uniref:Uncharacterized protein n=1 Tax=Romanomermis culicivorax TaxID=13658 RepID=A0A915IH67_ROMCU
RKRREEELTPDFFALDVAGGAKSCKIVFPNAKTPTSKMGPGGGGFKKLPASTTSAASKLATISDQRLEEQNKRLEEIIKQTGVLKLSGQ